MTGLIIFVLLKRRRSRGFPLLCCQSKHRSAKTRRPCVSGELGRGVPAAMGQVHPVLARGAGQGLCIILFAPHDDMFLGPSLYLGVLGMLLANGSLDETMQSLTAGCPVQAQGALWPFLRAVGGGLRLFPTLARVRCSLGQKPSPGLDGPLHRPPGCGVGWWWGSGSLAGLGGGGVWPPLLWL